MEAQHYRRPWRENGHLFNAVLLLENGTILTQRFQHLLPTYSVFDEDRVFSRSPIPGPILSTVSDLAS